MPQEVRSTIEEYWRPADPATARVARPVLAEGLCPDCGVKYSAGARFCHMCGGERNRRPVAAPSPMTFADYFDVAIIRQRLGLSVPCVVFFIFGLICMIAALGIGILYKADNLAEWQAMQLWRVEWLLGAAAALLAGILLKENEP